VHVYVSFSAEALVGIRSRLLPVHISSLLFTGGAKVNIGTYQNKSRFE